MLTEYVCDSLLTLNTLTDLDLELFDYLPFNSEDMYFIGVHVRCISIFSRRGGGEVCRQILQPHGLFYFPSNQSDPLNVQQVESNQEIEPCQR